MATASHEVRDVEKIEGEGDMERGKGRERERLYRLYVCVSEFLDLVLSSPVVLLWENLRGQTPE